ncbi:MAG: ABC transporter ATP-binding protein/permease [Roseburia sp.]|uniref:ABC transporter ATP-binding protein n=1 Tax=Roseburia sp. 831b TaxID=1261635 RepID=UPI000950C3EF|nr:ABC transporter ATP-binding protein [Roseburia sp. 831b]MCI5918765.1 ABC transporter ATP-binding protein/permease [Roseburia sp.]MDD6216088.1 ABC transporter ATP-binding protein [Roseburia sp.]WVK73067.1 ABC transporter ATP-binding protein [Roseburia sp. 831b]
MAVNSFREDEQMKHTDRKKILRRLFSYLLDYKLTIAGVLICMLVTVVIALVNPLLIEAAIDTYIAKGDVKGLLRLGIIALAMNIGYIILVKVRMYVMSVVSNKILLSIRQELYEHIQKLSFSFFDSRPTGKILARIIGDVNSLKDVLVNMVTTLLPEFATIVGVVVIMLVKDYRLGFAALSTVPLMMVAICIVQNVSHKRWQVYRKKSSNLNAYVHEDIAGMNVVQSFRAENETKEIFEDLTDQHQKSFVSAVVFADMFGPVIDFCWGFGSMIMYFVGIAILGVDHISVGLLVAFGSYINMFWNPIMNLSNFYNQLVTNMSAAERIFDILDTEPDIVDGKDVEELPEVKGAVTFDHVSFTYDKGTPAETKVLNDVNFQVKPGETIALVGPTGAGKTTIVNLISRFYDIEEGRILIDGHDLTKVSIESLRKQMGVMTQDNFIFHGTVRDNILYGKLDATDEEMIAAAKAVNAHDFIMKMEKGYDTELKERGAGLSIGQRQLIAFARTMISMPKILILDEATSSIDTHTELLVQQGIEALLAGRTSFVIAHRLSTIQNADRIFVIDKGGILEQGSPKELMEKKGFYYNLYMAQFAGLQ